MCCHCSWVQFIVLQFHEDLLWTIHEACIQLGITQTGPFCALKQPTDPRELSVPSNITKYRNVPGFREIPCFPFRSSTLLFVISFFIRFLFLKQDQSIALPFWYKIMLHIDARDFIGWEKRKSLPPANTTRNLWNHHWTLCISKKHTLLLSARGSPSLSAFYPFLCDSTFSEYLQPTLNLFSRLLFLYIPLEVGAIWLFYFCSQLFLVFLPCWSNRAPSCSWHSLPSWAQWD